MGLTVTQAPSQRDGDKAMRPADTDKAQDEATAATAGPPEKPAEEAAATQARSQRDGDEARRLADTDNAEGAVQETYYPARRQTLYPKTTQAPSQRNGGEETKFAGDVNDGFQPYWS